MVQLLLLLWLLLLMLQPVLPRGCSQQGRADAGRSWPPQLGAAVRGGPGDGESVKDAVPARDTDAQHTSAALDQHVDTSSYHWQAALACVIKAVYRVVFLSSSPACL